MKKFSVIALAVLGCIVLALVFRKFASEFRKPEVEMAPLSVLAESSAEDIASVGIVFSAGDGSKIFLTHGQIEALVQRRPTKAKYLKLLDHFGRPYAVSLLRQADRTAPHGYYYEWTIHDIGPDGALGTQDDVTSMYANRP